ncbi:MAG: peptidoglycan DD-metalloendopeptidase family protein [Candidatus Eisenbacteria bacterium]|nr:peptidoglycan DD-metalloendopeptidase family protein [Candidatus Eisenbacteria bacterium]
MRARHAALGIALALLLSPGRASHAATGPWGGSGTIVPPAHADGLPPKTRAAIEAAEAAARAGRPAKSTLALRPAFAQYAWPLERALNDLVVAVNYTDLDPGPGRLDYMGGTHNYDGHTGHDYTLTDFRDMDRGVRILAAASGTVTYLDDTSPYDRHCTFDWPDGGNWVWIAHGDGTFHEYLHMRRSSMTVKLGDVVQPGQMLGLVGSSGYSTAPHLHFESGDYSGPGGGYAFREPSHGSANPLPSLWNAQEGYAGDEAFHVTGLGVYTDAQVGGSVFNTGYCDVVNSIPQPLALGTNEDHLDMWIQFQSRAGDTAAVVVRKPDGAVYGSFDFVSQEPVQFGWFWAYYFFSPWVGPADHGTWRLQVQRGGTLVADRPFTVAGATTFAPRFWPRGGRSFRIDGTVQRDTLRRLPYGPPVTYSLLGAPSFVSLVQDSIVQVAATSSQPTRSAWFQVVMSDAAARRDTAFYHVVDMSKPLDPLAGAPDARPASGLSLSAGAQPGAGPVPLRYQLPAAGRISLAVFDANGRRVCTLLDEPRPAGSGSLRWDGRDRSGRAAVPGVYFARLTSGSTSVTTRVVRLAP